jgi:hypothetical protein
MSEKDKPKNFSSKTTNASFEEEEEEYDEMEMLERLETLREDMEDMGVTTLAEVIQRITELHQQLDQE